MGSKMKHNNMNILILSCGTRNKIVQYFRRELAGQGLLVATDCSELAPALYEADHYYVVPPIDADNYLEVILEICQANEIKGVLSLIDPELSLLAKHKDDFIQMGVLPIVSHYDVVEMCFNKYHMAEFLSTNGFLTPKSYICKQASLSDLSMGKISYPVFVKPVKGSASLNVNRVDSTAELEYLFNRFDGLMIQEFMAGKELGADVYIDLISGAPVSVFTKEKIKMRAGETDKSVSVKDEELFGLIVDFVRKARLMGIVDIDVFFKNGEYYISEVNPRFGGGYPHAHECGVNMVQMLLRNIAGIENEPCIGKYDRDVCMMKYSDILSHAHFDGH